MKLASILAILAFALSVGCTQNLSGANCDEGLTDCDGTCVDTSGDSDNCGVCGTVCGNGDTCVAGVCDLVCSAGEINCDGTCVDPQANDQFCGAGGENGDCAVNPGVVCAQDEACTDGACACAVGSFECIPGGGCNNLETEAEHCGACFNACAPNQTCMSGTCVSDTVVAGALVAQNGRWTFGGDVGVASADSECNINWAGSHACLRPEVEAAAAAGELVELQDTAGNTVAGLWIDDTEVADVLRCVDPSAENVPYSYQTGHFGHQGQIVELNNAAGTIGPITTEVCNAGTYNVLCCYP